MNAGGADLEPAVLVQLHSASCAAGRDPESGWNDKAAGNSDRIGSHRADGGKATSRAHSGASASYQDQNP